MRRHIITSVTILFGSVCAFAQSILSPIGQRQTSIDSNYVRTYNFTAADAAAYNVTEEHFDGLGRKQATIQRAFSPDKRAVGSYVYYDEVGREWKVSLPNIVTSQHIDTQPSRDTSSFSYGDLRPFSEIIYEASPLNRVVKKYGPGEKWKRADKGIRSSYLSNGRSTCFRLVDDFRDLHMEPYIERQGYWPAGSLSVTVTTDESGREVQQFNDENGKLILTRRKLGNRDLDTYRVYDSKDRLVAVLPPMASETLASKNHLSSSDEAVSRFAYLYMYDERDRCVAKKLPGCGWTYYIYDKGDRLIFTQDAEQRKRNQWVFSFSDAHGRPCLTGTCIGDKRQLEQIVSDKNVVVTRCDDSVNGYIGYMGYYISGEVSLTSPVVLSASYYDDYSFIEGILPMEYRSGMRYGDFLIGEYVPEKGSREDDDNYFVEEGRSSPVIIDRSTALWENVQGRLTGTAERILGEGITNDFKWNVQYYDRKGNVIMSRSTRGDGGIDFTATLVSFTGKPREVNICHDYCGIGEYDEYYEYTYDNWDRLLTVRHKIGAQSDWTTLSDLKYDAVGRVVSDIRTGTPELNITTSYNVRSWVKTFSGPGFSEELSYEPDEESGRRPISGALSEENGYELDSVQNEWAEAASVEQNLRSEWGGNISSARIRYGNQRMNKTFIQKYGYDDLSRLISASKSNNSQISKETYTYDDHTNMLSYIRTGSGTVLKTMTYQGNRMTEVESSEYSTPGAVNYDDIGRVVSSDIEGMTEVQYNVTGFPSYIGQADGGYVHNTYAGSVRLASRRTAADGEVTTMNYEGNEVWENGKLRMLLFDSGYVDFSGNLPKYCWYTKDHLGNVRAAADAQGYMVALYDYRPYGEELTALPADEYQDPVFPVRPGHGRDDDVDEPTPQPSPFVPTVNYSEAAPKGWQPFRFGGKESLTRVGLDLYDFGARMYSPSNMRWLTMDPLCEKYYHISPYAYCAGNPVNYVDMDGREIGDKETLWFCLTHPYKALRIGWVQSGSKNISTNAVRFATRGEILYGSKPREQEERGSEAGAFRHALWQAAICSKWDGRTAITVGDAHEENITSFDYGKTKYDSISEVDTAVDLRNNQVGRTFSSKGMNMKQLALRLLDVFECLGLYTAKQVGDGEWIIERTVLDEERAKQLRDIFMQLDENGFYESE